jgi:hypothetical protein
MNVEEGLVAIRRTQVGAAMGALSMDWGPADPFVEHFGPELVDSLAFQCPLDFSKLQVSTGSSGDSTIDRVERFINDVYDAPADISAIYRTLADITNDAISPGIILSKQQMVSGIRMGASGNQATVMAGFRTLELLGVQDDVILKLDTIRSRLLAHEVASYEISLDRPFGSPLFTITFEYPTDTENRESRKGQLDYTHQFLGISEAQRKWAGAMFMALTPRANNPVQVGVSLHRNMVLNRINVSYPQIPARLVLRLMSQLTPQTDHPGDKLGVLTGAAAMEEEIVSWLHLCAWDREPPMGSFSLDASRLPTTGSD